MKTAPAPLRYFVLLVVLLTIGGCQGSHAWNGNWKLNIAKSLIQGSANNTITTLPDGEIRLTNEVFNFDFRCDGKDYPNPNGKNLTTSCLQANATQWKVTYKVSGTIKSTAFWDLSSDATTLTIHGEFIQPDGSSHAFEYIDHRLSNGNGFSGRWQRSNPFEYQPKLLKLKLSLMGTRLLFAYPERDQYVDAQLNGTPTLMHRGPLSRDGFTMSLRYEGPSELHTESSFEGRVFREGILSLSNDGHTITEESWAPERLDEKDTLIYEKQ
jgi:hypothetical protein